MKGPTAELAVGPWASRSGCPPRHLVTLSDYRVTLMRFVVTLVLPAWSVAFTRSFRPA